MKTYISILTAILKGIRDIGISLLGIAGWLLQCVLQLLVLGFICTAVAALFIFARIKPELDHCREVAYDTLAGMQYQDFRLLSDTEVYDEDGTLIGLINAGHYEYVPIYQISPNLQNAYIAQEDRRFKSHAGVDMIAITRAGLALLKHRGTITQGGSTITQQVIKNTYLSQEQTFTRKIVEILLAPEVEKKYSKADIMEFYCNTNFYGNHCYGVQAASRYYFGKDAAALTVSEAAVLVGLSNSPSAYDPVRHPEAALEKRNNVLKSMLETGYLTQEECDNAAAQSLKIVQEETEGTNENYQSSYAIHCAALELMKADGFEFQYTFEDKSSYETYTTAYQNAYNEKTESIRGGGYQIYTALDSTIQEQLQAQLDAGLASFTELQENGKYALQGAAVIVDNQTNYVIAIVGGRGTEDPFNRAYLSARQPGSTIKPLIDYGPAFDTGEYYPSRRVNDHKWADGPSNSGGSYLGSVTVREALTRSLNTVAWQILEDIGVNFGLNYLGEMAFQRITYIDNDVPSLSIGGFTNGLRVVDMAKGYSTLANNGVYNDRTCITRIIHEQNGEILQERKGHARQVYQEDTAFILTDILKGTLTQSYGTGYGLSLSNDMPAAGKTGTTNSSKDTWFCGYTRYYATAVWVGYDIPKAMPGIYGSTYAGKIWRDTMNQIHDGLEPRDWEQPHTVEKRPDEKTGITDYFSITSELRASQSLHDKEQRRLTEELQTAVNEFETKIIETVEDTYWVNEKYKSIITKLNMMDEGELRGELLERTAIRYELFSGVIADMQDTIAMYEEQRARERETAQKAAEAAAVEARKALEAQTRKEEFLTALEAVEELEYQAPEAARLVETAIDKLPLVADYSEAVTYKARLETAISRISALPTAQEWQKQEEARQLEEARQQTQVQQQIAGEQHQLEALLNNQQRYWNNNPITGPGGEK